MKNIEIEFLTSKYNNDKESDYIEGHFTIHKTMSDNDFLKLDLDKKTKKCRGFLL